MFVKTKKEKIQKLNMIKFDNSSHKGQYKKLASENVELCRIVDEYEAKMIEIEDEIIAYSKQKDSSQVPEDSAVWNVVNEETEDYAYMCRNM